MKKLISVLLIVSMLAVCLSACSNNDKKDTQNEETETRVVVDHLDHEITIPKEVNRVVVTNIYPLPSVITVFLDSAEKIVGMHPASMSAAKVGVLSELYPEILNAQTNFMSGSEINIEELLKLNPDVVFYSASVPSMGDKLAEAGIPALAVSVNKWDYNVMETYNHWIELLAEVFPEHAERYNKVMDYSTTIYDKIQNRVNTLSDEEKKSVLFVFKYDSGEIFTSGENFFGQFWCDATGSINSAFEIKMDNSAPVNMEQIYEWNPDAIVITNFTSVLSSDIINNKVDNDDWSEIEAVKNGDVFKMPLGTYRSYTPGVDTPVTMLWLAQKLYPSLFEDINIADEIRNYYKDVYGIALTDKQIENVFNTTAEAAGGMN